MPKPILTTPPSHQPVRQWAEMGADEQHAIIDRLSQRLGQVVASGDTLPSNPLPLGEGEPPAACLDPSVQTTLEEIPVPDQPMADEDQALMERIVAFLEARQRPATIEHICTYLDAQFLQEVYEGLADVIGDGPIAVQIDGMLPATDLNRYRLRTVRDGRGRWSNAVRMAIAAFEAAARDQQRICQDLIDG